jgi:hypothetical protein
MHHHRQLLASVSVLATLMAAFSVTLAAPQVDAMPRPKASFITISQPQTSGTAGIPLSCTGRVQTFAVTVSSLGVAFQPGDAQASGFVLIERRGRTQQAQDSVTIQLV